MRILTLIWCTLAALSPLLGQDAPLEPFVCRGGFYQAMAPFVSSAIHEVVVDPDNGRIGFSMLPAGNLGTAINPIGYRISDNFIYGLSPLNLGLYRIGADGRGKRLGTIDALDDGLDYPAGAISPDGRYMVLLGVRQGSDPLTGSTEVLVFIDLDSPDFALRKVDLVENNIQSFDIAFDPIDGKLYGFNATERRLFYLNTDNGDIASLPTANANAESLGSLFFDPFGRLYAYGNQNRWEKQSSYFAIDKATGRTTLLAKGPEAQLTDGCSCPYTVAMEERISPASAVACTEITVTLDLVNSSGVERSGLSLLDTFPPGFTIVSLDLPLAADIVSGAGTRLLHLENLALPLGQSQITITLRTDASVSGSFPNQARLEGLPLGLGQKVVSDNPNTLVREDASPIVVTSLQEGTQLRELRICPKETLILDPGIAGVSYQWDDGSTENERTINGPGTYRVAVGSPCQTDTITFRVELDALDVSLPAATRIPLGDSLLLRPSIVPDGELDYQWESSNDELECPTCRDIVVNPLNDVTYTFSAYDPITGCRTEASIFVEVEKDRAIFLPNAFSPNGDGQNDYFFPQSRLGERIRRMRIFNRWGEVVFQQQEFDTNDPSRGWNGTLRGQPLPPGPYFYVLEVTFRDQYTEMVKGEITLIR